MHALTILTRAKALMDAGRWLKGEFHEKARKINVKTGKRAEKGREVTCYCASGAIRAVAGNHDYDEAERIFIKANDLPGYVEGSTIWNWNDADNRTVGDVRKAFRKAVALARRLEA